MADENVCQINLTGLNEEDQEMVKDQVKRLLAKAEEVDIQSLDDAVNASLKDYTEKLLAAAKIQKRNAYLNKVKRQEYVDHILTNWSDDAAEGLVSYLVGTQLERTGSRRSVDVAISQTQNRYKSMLGAKLTNANLLNQFKSGLFDEQIYVAMHALDNKKPLTGLTTEAVEIAKILNSVMEVLRTEANKNGAFIGDLPGYVISRGHDMFKIDKDKQGWIDWMLVNVDWSKSLVGLPEADRVKVLTEQVKEFASGAHVTESLSEPGTGQGFSSIAKSMSRSRQYHFKTPELEYQYSQQFGYAGLADSVLSNIESKGRNIAMMQRLGPNAKMTVQNVYNDLLKIYKKNGVLTDSDQMKKLEKAIKDINTKFMPTLTGETTIPGHHLGATIESLLLTTQRISSLGGSAIASVFGDSVVGAMNVARVEKGFSGFMTGMHEYIRALGTNIKDPAAMDEIIDLGTTNDALVGMISSRFTDNDAALTKGQRRIRNVENQFFFWNGQYYVDNHARVGSALALSSRVGLRVGKSFDEIESGYKTLFDSHSIGKAEWDVARLSTRKGFYGTDVIHIEGIKDLDVSVIDQYLADKKIKPTKYQRAKAQDEIISRFRSMFQDQQGYQILTADARLRANMFGGSQAGTLGSFARKSFFQFKQFPLSYLQKAIGKDRYSNSPLQDKVMNIAATVIVATIGGYMTAVVRDTLNGKTPKGFTQQAMTEAVFRGGGLGIYGDLFNQMYNDNYGTDILTALGGPMVQDVNTVLGIGSGVLQGSSEKIGDNTVKLITQNLPFTNIPVFKNVVDYMFMNSVKELISPGSLQRAENKLQQNYDQTYWMNKPSETMLFK
jgi:hypothetical protein